MNILFTCAGRRNYLINYFKKALNGAGQVIAADSSNLAPALADGDIALLVPPIDHPDYISTLKEVCVDYKVTAIFSLNDLELPLLAQRKREFESRGVRVVVSDSDVIDVTFDKWRTAQFLKRAGIGTPRTWLTLEGVLDALRAGEVQFPLVVKPRWGSASIGIEYVQNEEELRLVYSLAKIRLRRSILSKVSERDIDRAILIQEKLAGDEYGVDILNDLNGNYVRAFAKKKLGMRAGETDKAQSVEIASIEHTASLIAKHLRHIGNLDCDFFFGPDGVCVLEMNARFGGGYPFTHEAGADFPALLLAWLRRQVVDAEEYLKFRVGLKFAKCDRLVKVGHSATKENG